LESAAGVRDRVGVGEVRYDIGGGDDIGDGAVDVGVNVSDRFR
jgi:hypothetical protein